MPEKVKDIIYIHALFWTKIKSKILKRNKENARIFLATESSILLVQHRKSLSWNLPGGGKKQKENPEQCALRELFEETNIRIDTTDFLLGTYTSEHKEKKDTIFIFVKKQKKETTPKHSLEIKQAKWFSLSDLPEKISPATKARVFEYLQGGKNLQGKW